MPPRYDGTTCAEPDSTGRRSRCGESHSVDGQRGRKGPLHHRKRPAIAHRFTQVRGMINFDTGVPARRAKRKITVHKPAIVRRGSADRRRWRLLFDKSIAPMLAPAPMNDAAALISATVSPVCVASVPPDSAFQTQCLPGGNAVTNPSSRGCSRDACAGCALYKHWVSTFSRESRD